MSNIIDYFRLAKRAMDYEMTILGLAKKWKAINKALGFTAAGLLILYGILSFTVMTTQINYLILQIYYFLFAGLILLGEFNVKSTLQMFGFLGNLFGKGLFIVLLGISMFAEAFTLKMIVAILLVVIGVVYMGLFFIPRRITDDKGKAYEDRAGASPAAPK